MGIPKKLQKIRNKYNVRNLVFNKNIMKKIIWLICLIFILVSCGENQQEINNDLDNSENWIKVNINENKEIEKQDDIIEDKQGAIKQDVDKESTEIVKNTYSNENIEIKFKTSFELSDDYRFQEELEIKEVILFGPLWKFWPMEWTEPRYIHRLYVKKQNDAEIIIKEINDLGAVVSEKPKEVLVWDFSIVTWREWGTCDVRIVELIGNKNNYRFISDGCHNSEEEDFNYFKDIIKEIKFK